VTTPRALPGVRTTRQRTAVADLLERVDGFKSAQDLHRLLEDGGTSVGLTTVYRHLQALADAGQVDVLRTDDGEAVYRRCPTAEHHHHLVCRSCGRSVEVDGPEVEAWAAQVARARVHRGHAHGRGLRHLRRLRRLTPRNPRDAPPAGR
jgi:Fur family transcriptional regulator, ferric uptake regulator